MSEKFYTEEEIKLSYKGRCDSERKYSGAGYCGSCSIDIHREQLADKDSWVQTSVLGWIVEATKATEPTKAELVAYIDKFWLALHQTYNIETREEIEKDCKESWAEDASPLEVALHFIWKREPKVAKLIKALEEIAERVPSTTDHGDYNFSDCGTCEEIIETASKALNEHKENQ